AVGTPTGSKGELNHLAHALVTEIGGTERIDGLHHQCVLAAGRKLRMGRSIQKCIRTYRFFKKRWGGSRLHRFIWITRCDHLDDLHTVLRHGRCTRWRTPGNGKRLNTIIDEFLFIERRENSWRLNTTDYQLRAPNRFFRAERLMRGVIQCLYTELV